MQWEKRAEELGEGSHQNVSKNIKHVTNSKENGQNLKRKRKESPGQVEDNNNQSQKAAKTQGKRLVFLSSCIYVTLNISNMVYLHAI